MEELIPHLLRPQPTICVGSQARSSVSVQYQQQASTVRPTQSQLETQQCHPNLSTPSHEDEPLITPSNEIGYYGQTTINQFNQYLEEREEHEQDEDYREEVSTKVMGLMDMDMFVCIGQVLLHLKCLVKFQEFLTLRRIVYEKS
ncbi:hypothetical protein GBA52_024533 [Prunus armeniaca]|nr:hypothetical protein GBA52_024533 [Prunus armeniaca]